MTDDERDLFAADSAAAADDLRFAPPASAQPDSAVAAEVAAPQLAPDEALDAALDEPSVNEQPINAEPLPTPQAIETSPDEQLDFVGSFNNAETLDIVGALAAVSSLSDLVVEREAAEQARAAQAEAEAQAAAQRRARAENPEAFFPTPPLLKVQRGSLASVIPAVGLIGLGIWLTLTLTSGAALDTWLVADVALDIAVVALLARWLTSGRWSRGLLFLALSSLFVLGGGYLLARFQPYPFAQLWPLLLVALGVTFPLSGWLAQPRENRYVGLGVALSVAGLVGLAVTFGALPAVVLEIARSLWPFVLAVLAVLLVVPLLRRRA